MESRNLGAMTVEEDSAQKLLRERALPWSI